MVVALNSSMSRALMSLISINQDIAATQARINTGKSINDPSDNIAIFFKARSYSDKADLYQTVNATITQGSANLDFVDKALSNMIDNVKGARQVLTDAKAKPVTASAPVSFVGRQSYASSTVTVGGVVRTVKGQIVDPSTGAGANANIADGAYFQAGDVFRVDLRDASNNTTVTRYFKAVAPDATATPDQSRKGDSAANAIEFSDVATLATALNLGFGRASASFDPVATTSGGVAGYSLSMALATNTQSITFGQVVDTTVTTASGAATAGDSFDFTKLLQNAKTSGAAVTVGNTLDAANAPSASSWLYAPVSGVTSDPSVTDVRRQAADFFRQTMYGLDATVRDAALPGFANVLRGETMSVALNDTGTLSQTVKLATPVDFTQSVNSGNAFGVTLGNNAGTITTAYTDTGNANSSNFLDDASLGNAIRKLDSIATLLGQQRTLIAASKTAMASRLDLNKAMAATLTDTANAMTAADVAQESTNLAALQTRQSFAATGLTLTKQAEQYLLGLLR